MLAADTELQILACCAPSFRRNAYEFANAFLIDRHKRIARNNTFVHVVGEERS